MIVEGGEILRSVIGVKLVDTYSRYHAHTLKINGPLKFEAAAAKILDFFKDRCGN